MRQRFSRHDRLNTAYRENSKHRRYMGVHPFLLAGGSVLSMAFAHILAVCFLGLVIIKNGGRWGFIPSENHLCDQFVSGFLVLVLFSPIVFAHGLVEAGFLGALDEGRQILGFLGFWPTSSFASGNNG